MEDYFATERNGHQSNDFYDPETNILDIRSNGAYPSDAMSDLSSNGLNNISCVVFSHGKESGPLGRKIQRLMAVAEEFGLQTVSVDYRKCSSATERVQLLNDSLNQLDMPL